MKNKKILLIIAIFLFTSIGAAGAWLVFGNSSTPKSKTQTLDQANQDSINMQQVAQNNGQNGKSCWVVVDGTVYEISGFAKWVDGMHSSSAGKASCGKDLSSVINESPHGKSKLRLLKEIGKLSQ